MKKLEKYLNEGIEDKIHKTNGLPKKLKIIYNEVKKGSMSFDEFQNIAWRVYNNTI